MAGVTALVVGGAALVAGGIKAYQGGKDKKRAKDKQKAAEQGMGTNTSGISLSSVDAKNIVKNYELVDKASKDPAFGYSLMSTQEAMSQIHG